MSEVNNPDVKEESVAPTDEEQVVIELQDSEEPKKGSAEYNFRELRKKNEELERELRNTQQYFKELQNGLKKEEPPKDEIDLTKLHEDDWLTVKQAQQIARRQAEELLKQREFDTLEDRMRMKFKDYDEVVSEENVLKLIEDDDELAQTIRNSPNPYTAAYKLIKKSSFYKEAEEGKKYKEENNNIQKNAQKPVSSNSVQPKPLARANTYANMDKAEMDALYREMTECARRR